MSKTGMGLGLVLVLAVSACANERLPYPQAVVGPGMEQQVVRSAGHWNLLAQHESAAIVDALTTTPTFHVAVQPGNPSPFERAYHDMLVSGLVDQGAQVFMDRADALLTVDYDIQTVIHDRRDRQRWRPGVATATLAAAAVLYDAAENWGEPEMVLIPVAVGVDLWNSLWPNAPKQITEVVINTRVHDGRRIIRSDSRVYYFNAADLQNFADDGKTFRVVGASQEL